MLRLPKDDTYISDSIKEYITKELGIMWNEIYKIQLIGKIELNFINGHCQDVDLTFPEIPNYQLLFMHTDDDQYMRSSYIIQEILLPLNGNNISRTATISRNDLNNNLNSYETLINVNPITGRIIISDTQFLNIHTTVYGPTYKDMLNEKNGLIIFGIGLKKKFNLFGILTHLFSLLFKNKIRREVC